MLRLYRIAPRLVRLHNGKPSVLAQRLSLHRNLSTTESVQVETTPSVAWNEVRDNLKLFKQDDNVSMEKGDNSSLEYVAVLDRTLRAHSTDNLSPVHSRIHGNIVDLYESRYKEALEDEGLCEQKIIDTRIATWTTERLVEEGYSLFDLVPVSIRNLFQEKVVRFHARNGKKLDFHRFGAGDIIRLSAMDATGGPLQGPGAEATILDRSPGFLDICIQSGVLSKLNLQKSFRVDFSRNNTSYKRMNDGLQSLLKTTTDTSTEHLPNRLRDLLVYSYPNSIVRLARSPGGLKLALPLLHAPSATATTDPGDPHAVVAAASNINGVTAEQPLVDAVAVPQTDPVGSAENASVATATGAVLPQITEPRIPYPIFHTDERMRMLAKLIPEDHMMLSSEEVECSALTRPYTPSELKIAFQELRLIQELNGVKALNEHQTAALEAALQQRPLTLIQGPPGTGKTKTACHLLTMLVLLKDERFMNSRKTSRHALQKSKILACTHSNVAADNLLSGLAHLGANVIRLGRPAGVRPDLWEYTLEAKVQDEPRWVQYRVRLDKAIQAVESATVKAKSGVYADSLALDRAQAQLKKAQSEFSSLEYALRLALLENAENAQEPHSQKEVAVPHSAC